MKNRKKVASYIGAGAGFIAAYILARLTLSPSIEEKLQNIAAEMNKSCPVAVDEFTRLDSIVVPADSRTIQYYYTLSGVEDGEMDYTIIQETLEPEIIEKISAEPEMKELRDNDVSFEYIYMGAEKIQLTRFIITPGIYKNPDITN